MTQTKRELEMEVYSQRLYALEAQQKAEDVGYALEMLLNNRLKLFYTTTTSSNNAKHEFLFGIAKNAPVDDIPGVLKTGDTREDRRIILWKTTFESGYVIGSTYHDGAFKSSPGKFADESPELKELLLEAIRQLPASPCPQFMEDLIRIKPTYIGAFHSINITVRQTTECSMSA